MDEQLSGLKADVAALAATVDRLTWRVDCLLERIVGFPSDEVVATNKRLEAFTESFRGVEKRFSELALADTGLRAEVQLLMTRLRDLLFFTAVKAERATKPACEAKSNE